MKRSRFTRQRARGFENWPIWPSAAGTGAGVDPHEAIGVNFIEITFARAWYKRALPLTPGSEAAGTVEELGPG